MVQTALLWLKSLKGAFEKGSIAVKAPLQRA